MKTIEERAKEYIKEGGSIGFPLEDNYFFEEAFIAGAKSEHEELTRWNNPECPPDSKRPILLKIRIGLSEKIYYRVGHFVDGDYTYPGRVLRTEYLGWKEIYDNE